MAPRNHHKSIEVTHRPILLLAAALLITHSIAATADLITGNEFIEMRSGTGRYSNWSAEDIEVLCSSIVSGFRQGVGTTAAFLASKHGDGKEPYKPLLCGGEHVTLDQIKKMFDKNASKVPEYLSTSYGHLLLPTLMTLYPCR